MLPLRRVGWFFLRLLLIYGLLAAPWPGLQEAYSSAYRAAGNFMFGSFGPGGTVEFQPSSTTRRGLCTEILVESQGARYRGRVPHSARLTGYLPTAEVIALILALPIPWSRRWKALFWGLVLVNGFVVLRLEITLLYWFSGDRPFALYSPGPFWSEVLVGAREVVVVSPMLTFAVPVFIWILVTFRRGDLEQWMAPRMGGKPVRNRADDRMRRGQRREPH